MSQHSKRVELEKALTESLKIKDNLQVHIEKLEEQRKTLELSVESFPTVSKGFGCSLYLSDTNNLYLIFVIFRSKFFRI